MNRGVIFLALALGGLLPGRGQPLQIGLGLSGIAYVGDLSDPGLAYPRIQAGGELWLQRESGRRLRPLLSLSLGRFADQYDAELPSLPPGFVPPTYVETRFWTGDLRLQYRLFPQGKWQPSLSAGAGLIGFSPRDPNGRRLLRATDSRPAGETYNTVVPQLPLGAALHYRIHPQLRVGLAGTYRFVPSDYLDNIGAWGGREGFDALYMLSLQVQLSLPGSRS